MAESFKKKKLVTNLKTVSTIADGIAVKRPSQIMYDSFISQLCDDVVTVSEDEIAQAIVLLMERNKKKHPLICLRIGYTNVACYYSSISSPCFVLVLI